MVRLVDGVMPGRGLRVWGPGPEGQPEEAGAGLPPGAPVAVGPADADTAEVRSALAELARLVAAGGSLAAGAGVRLDGGFWSARLDGGRGDRRDAVLAALRVLGRDDQGRLGDRAGVLVGLFGPAATKPVGAAAGRAINEGRWAALHLACAASDLLGPERLEVLLRLDPGEGVDPIGGGRPSVLADHLGRALGSLTQQRRLGLLLDAWEAVRAHHADTRRRDLRRTSQGRQSRADDLRRRYQHHDNELLLEHVQRDLGYAPSPADAARWIPDTSYWRPALRRALHDSLAATALLRAAVVVSDHGMEEGLERCRDELAAAATMLDSQEAGRAARRVAGLTGLPARPGCYVRDLHTRLARRSPGDPVPAAYVRQRLVRARDYGIVVLEAVADLLWMAMDQYADHPDPPLRGWSERDLRAWRSAADYARPPAEWEQPVLFGQAGPGAARPLAERLTGQPPTPPAEVETAGDLLWYAELGDALARLHGHDTATVQYGEDLPHIAYDPPTPDPAPLTERMESLPLAVAGAAQLVSLGGQPPHRCRTWAELVDGLMADSAVAEALTGEFQVPEILSALDGATVPGTRARVEWARTPRTLAEWAEYMGNCISGDHYVADAERGQCALGALRGANGRVLANIEIRPSGPAGHGWRIAEFRGRFNNDPDPDLARAVRAWVATFPPPAPASDTTRPAPTPAVRPRGTSRSGRLFHDVHDPLRQRAERALAGAGFVEATHVLEGVARRLARDGRKPGDPVAALTTLRRATPERLARACRDALPVVGLAEVWDATGVRPLAEALAGLDADLLRRFERLERLLVDAPLPGSLRKLARSPAVAPARSMELVTRRVRAVLARLTRDDDPVLAQCVTRRPTTPLLCALAITTTSWAGAARAEDAPDLPLPPMTPAAPAAATSVPGFPPSDLNDVDGPWHRAWPDARELGADPEPFWTQVAASGLVVPTAWLVRGGWNVLWSRAARNRGGS